MKISFLFLFFFFFVLIETFLSFFFRCLFLGNSVVCDDFFFLFTPFSFVDFLSFSLIFIFTFPPSLYLLITNLFLSALRRFFYLLPKFFLSLIFNLSLSLSLSLSLTHTHTHTQAHTHTHTHTYYISLNIYMYVYIHTHILGSFFFLLHIIVLCQSSRNYYFIKEVAPLNIRLHLNVNFF